MAEGQSKPIEWVGSSLDDLRDSPEQVRGEVGFAAQRGGKYVSAGPLPGLKGAGVLEIVEDPDGNTYRAIHTVRFKSALCVLHAFQKKSRKGIRTPQHERDRVEGRLKEAAEHCKETYARQDE